MSDITHTGSTAKASAPRYVFEAPVRLWHWVHAITIGVLAVTGYFIANPLTSIGGEASEHFVMGTLRLWHLVAAHVFAVAFLARIYWALVGNRYSRELFIMPFWRGEWWSRLIYELRYYTFTTREVHKEVGHNPLAQLTYFTFNVLLVLVLIATGYAMHGEQLGHDSWADKLFGWVIPLLGNAQEVRMWHYTAMWVMLAFIILHVYIAVRADITGRQSGIGVMISGWRIFKDDRP
jgi:Ni/Fe-hydrogenase 1 B-type cytochrome subunit